MTIALLIFLFPLAWSPGPGNLLFAANAGRFGIGATVPALAGYHIATLALTWAVARGMAHLLVEGTAIAHAMRLAGAGYVMWMAFGMWRTTASQERQARPMGFGGGAALLILNPKAWVIIALITARFGEAATPLWLSVVFTMNNLVAFLGWMLAGRVLLGLFGQPVREQWLNRFMALMLAGVAIWMMLGLQEPP